MMRFCFFFYILFLNIDYFWKKDLIYYNIMINIRKDLKIFVLMIFIVNLLIIILIFIMLSDEMKFEGYG